MVVPTDLTREAERDGREDVLAEEVSGVVNSTEVSKNGGDIEDVEVHILEPGGIDRNTLCELQENDQSLVDHRKWAELREKGFFFEDGLLKCTIPEDKYLGERDVIVVPRSGRCVEIST